MLEKSGQVRSLEDRYCFAELTVKSFTKNVHISYSYHCQAVSLENLKAIFGLSKKNLPRMSLADIIVIEIKKRTRHLSVSLFATKFNMDQWELGKKRCLHKNC